MVLDEFPSSSWVHNYTTWVSHGCLCSLVGSPWCLAGSGNITGSATYTNTAHHEAPGSFAREWGTEFRLCVATGVGALESMCWRVHCVCSISWFRCCFCPCCSRFTSIEDVKTLHQSKLAFESKEKFWKDGDWIWNVIRAANCHASSRRYMILCSISHCSLLLFSTSVLRGLMLWENAAHKRWLSRRKLALWHRNVVIVGMLHKINEKVKSENRDLAIVMSNLRNSDIHCYLQRARKRRHFTYT